MPDAFEGLFAFTSMDEALTALWHAQDRIRELEARLAWFMPAPSPHVVNGIDQRYKFETYRLVSYEIDGKHVELVLSESTAIRVPLKAWKACRRGLKRGKIPTNTIVTFEHVAVNEVRLHSLELP